MCGNTRQPPAVHYILIDTSVVLVNASRRIHLAQYLQAHSKKKQLLRNTTMLRKVDTDRWQARELHQPFITRWHDTWTYLHKWPFTALASALTARGRESVSDLLQRECVCYRLDTGQRSIMSIARTYQSRHVPAPFNDHRWGKIKNMQRLACWT